MIKTIFSYLIPIVVILSCSGNSKNQAELINTFNEDITIYFDHMNTENWDEMMNMTNPNLFTITPKERLIGLFKSLKESGIAMNVSEIDVNEYSEIVNYKDTLYTKINYEGVLTMTLNNQLMGNIEMFKQELYKTYPKESVVIDTENKKIIIEAEKEIVAMSTNNKQSWTYFEIQAGQEVILNKLIPSEVIPKLN